MEKKIKTDLTGMFSRLRGKLKKLSARGGAVSEYRSPSDGMNPVMTVIGTCLRALVIFTVIFGLTLMLFDSLGIYKETRDFREYSVPVLPLVLIALAFSLLISFIEYNKITRWALPCAALVVLLAFPTVAFGSPVAVYENALRRVWNDGVEYIAASRFTSLARFTLSGSYILSKEALYIWAAVAIAAVLSVILYFAVCRRTSLLLFALLYFVWWMPLFMFNLPRSNTGFVLSTCAIFAFLALRGCDRRHGGYPEKKQAAKAARKKKRENAKSLSLEKKLSRVRINSTADIVYEKAIEASMTEKKARRAARLVKKRLNEEKREALKRDRRADKIKKKEEKKNIAAEKKAQRARISELKKSTRGKKLSDAGLTADERNYLEKASEKKRRKVEERAGRFRLYAASGFAGAAVLLIVLLALWAPSLIAKKSFRTVGFIDEKVRLLRQYADDLLMSDDVDLTRRDLYSYPEQMGFEKLTFEAREYEGNLIYYTESETKSNVYLKTRTAYGFDLRSDTWQFADNQKVIDTARYFGSSFTCDSVTSDAYRLLYPSSDALPARSTYSIFAKYGFNVQHIHMKRINGDSKLLAIPSVLNPEIGLLQRGSDEEAPHKYTSYYDGVYTSHYYGSDSAGYSCASYIYDMKRDDLAGVLEAESICFDALGELSVKYKKGSDSPELESKYKNAFENALIYYDIGERYINDMNAEERALVDGVIAEEQKYRAWVYENYTSSGASEEIKALSSSLVSPYEKRHDMVMAVIRYLTGDDFTYTLTPKDPEDREKSVLETFLFDTKEGYSNHFTASAFLLLREAGIPVRFAEGYIARGWFDGYGNDVVAKYTSFVFDENAHTWIEVYYDGIGWIPYETTPIYADEMYGTDKTEPSGNAGGQTEPEDNESSDREIETLPTVIPEEEEETEISPLEKFRWLLIALAVFLVLHAAFSVIAGVIRKRAMAVVDRKYQMIADAKNDSVFRDKSRDKKEIERFLIDNIFMILKNTGVGPEKGELLSEFAERITGDFSGISTKDPVHIMNCIRRSEFGGALSFAELSDLAEFTSDITVSLYSGLSPLKKLQLRYLKHVI